MSTTVFPAETTFQTFTLPKAHEVRPKVFVPRYAIPNGLVAAESTTYGWDTVNCIRLPLANDVLSKSADYPKELKMTLNPDEKWTIDTQYDSWQISSGGSGAILMMKLPLKKAILTYGSNELIFQNGYALISIKLRYLPQPSLQLHTQPQEANPIDIEYLIANAQAQSTDDPAVVIQFIDYGDVHPNDSEKALFVASLSQLLNVNLAAFTHVFAIVNLNQRAAQKQFEWLKPTYTSYAYFQGLTDDSSYFAILNQTQGRSEDGLTNQVAASAIPAGMNAAILVSSSLFVRQFVMPGLTRAFTHADSDAFQMSNRDTAIENTKRIQLDNVKVGAVNYTPYIDNFRFQIVGDEVQINTKISINISPGIDAYVDATYYYAIGLVEKADGTMTLDFEPSGDPLINTWYTVAFWVTMTQLIVSIIGAVIGAVVGEAIKTVVTKVMVIVLITIISGVIAAIPSIIADVISKGAAEVLPSIGPMIDEATDPVEWPKSSGFTLKSAELNGAFQIGGLLSA